VFIIRSNIVKLWFGVPESGLGPARSLFQERKRAESVCQSSGKLNKKELSMTY